MEAPFLQYGALGASVLALGWFAWTMIQTTIQREKDRADAAEARYQELSESVRAEMVPALIRCTDAVTRVMDLLPDLIAATKRR